MELVLPWAQFSSPHPPHGVQRAASASHTSRTRSSPSTSPHLPQQRLRQPIAVNDKAFSSVSSLVQRRIIELCRDGNLQGALLLLQRFPSSGSSLAGAVGALLQACDHRGALEVGRGVHNIMSSSKELMGNTVLTTRLLTMYSMCGSPSDAQLVFEELEGHELFHWNALISGYSRNELWREALDAFACLLLTTALRPDNFTLPCVLRACSGCPSVDTGKAVHGLCLKMGLDSDTFVCNSLISMYGRCGDIDNALQMFAVMPEQNVVSWNTMMCVFVESGFLVELLGLFKDMLFEGRIEPDDATLVTILPVCAAEKWIEAGRSVHGMAVKLGFRHQLRVNNALIDMYSKCGYLIEAKMLFDKTSKRNVVSWNAMIGGFARNGDMFEMLELLRKMPVHCIDVDDITILNALPACLEQFQILILKELHGYAVRKRYQFNDLLSNALISAYTKCGSIRYAHNIFSSIETKTVSSWNALIGGCAQNDDPKKAIDLYLEMTLSGLEPDLFSIGSLLLACTHLRYLVGGKSIHGFILRNKLERDPFLSASLMSLYVQCGDLLSAQMLFSMTEENNLVSWNIMISGMSQNGLPCEALQLFRQMQQKGYTTSSIAITSVFMACSQLSALRQGKEMHCFSLKANFCNDTFVGSSIIDMYAKCGSIDYCRKFFDELPYKDVVSWNIMITGYGIHGRGLEALELFERMQKEEVKPDVFTFIGILMACSHSGLVEQGLEFFETMKMKHRLEPKIEHYSCVVDMLGRAGQLEEAENLIEEMPEKPDGRIFCAVLGACKIHGDVNLGEKILKKLLKLEPHKAEHYVLAANLFAGSGRWEDTASLRSQMQDMGLHKEVGLSWISVDGRLYEFTSGND